MLQAIQLRHDYPSREDIWYRVSRVGGVSFNPSLPTIQVRRRALHFLPSIQRPRLVEKSDCQKRNGRLCISHSHTPPQ